MDRGAWRAIVLGVARSQTQLSNHYHIILVFPPGNILDVVLYQHMYRSLLKNGCLVFSLLQTML